jgi:hypothetical protein
LNPIDRENEWQIRAHCPGAEIQYITGFKSKAKIEERLASSRREAWLRERGYT